MSELIAKLLFEALDLTEAKIDAENRTVRQRIIVQGESANKRVYSDSVLQTAKPLFEGVRTYSNHPSKADLKDRPERSVREITGWIDGVVYENGALYGTRHFTRTQAGNDSWVLVEDILSGKMPPHIMGGSINAIGKARVEKSEGGERVIVESIDRVLSVDDVTVPAAGGGFALTASEAVSLESELLSLVSFQEWFDSHPDYIQRLKKEWQTVRLEEVTKVQLAEADVKVKAAEKIASDAQQALKETQEHVTRIETQMDKLTALNEQLRIEIAVDKMLEGVRLPPEHMNDLRKRLPTAPGSEWKSMIETEVSKAKRIPPAKVAVTFASTQETQPIQESELVSQSLMPLDSETTREWQERLLRLKQQRN